MQLPFDVCGHRRNEYFCSSWQSCFLMSWDSVLFLFPSASGEFHFLWTVLPKNTFICSYGDTFSTEHRGRHLFPLDDDFVLAFLLVGQHSALFFLAFTDTHLLLTRQLVTNGDYPRVIYGVAYVSTLCFNSCLSFFSAPAVCVQSVFTYTDTLRIHCMQCSVTLFYILQF